MFTAKNPDWSSRSGSISLLLFKGPCAIYRANKWSEILLISQGVGVSCWTRCSWPFLKSFLERNNRMNTSHAVLIVVSKIWFLFSYQTEMQTPAIPLKAFNYFLVCSKVSRCSRSSVMPSKKLEYFTPLNYSQGNHDVTALIWLSQ